MLFATILNILKGLKAVFLGKELNKLLCFRSNPQLVLVCLFFIFI